MLLFFKCNLHKFIHLCVCILHILFALFYLYWKLLSSSFENLENTEGKIAVDLHGRSFSNLLMVFNFSAKHRPDSC